MRPCPSCGEGRSEVAFDLSEADRMRRCAACGSLFPEAPPSAETAYDAYYTSKPPTRGWRRLARAIADSSRAGYLRRNVPAEAMRVLDFGCGDGAFLERVARPGRALFGVDRFAPCRAGGRWTRLAEEEIEARAPYDWITLGHVLEHLDDPAATLRRLGASLAADGGLWIATPNADSFLIRAAGASARDIDYPRHRQIFSRKGLERLAGRAGLTIRPLPSPALNTLLNARQTLARLRTDGSPARVGRLALGAFAARATPELVAICRRRGEPGP